MLISVVLVTMGLMLRDCKNCNVDYCYVFEVLALGLEVLGVVFLVLGYCCTKGGTDDDVDPIVA